jgi:hypothetical protein
MYKHPELHYGPIREQLQDKFRCSLSATDLGSPIQGKYSSLVKLQQWW